MPYEVQSLYVVGRGWRDVLPGFLFIPRRRMTVKLSLNRDPFRMEIISSTVSRLILSVS